MTSKRERSGLSARVAFLSAHSKLSLSPHKSSHGIFLDSHSRFIQDPGCESVVESHPRLQNNFNQVFNPVRHQPQFPFQPQNLIFETRLVTADNKARKIQPFRLKPGISLSPVKPNVTKYEKILDAANFASSENWILDSKCQSGDRILCTVKRIPKYRIADATSKDFIDSGFHK